MSVAITKKIVKELHKFINTPVVPTDTIGKKPDYPYASYKIIGSHGTNTYSREDKIVESLTSHFEYDVQVTHKGCKGNIKKSRDHRNT